MGFGKPLLIRYETSGKLPICANNASQYFVHYAVTLLCKSTLYTLSQGSRSRYFLLSNTKNSWNQQMTNIPIILLSHVSSLNTSTRRYWRERKQFPYTLPCTATQIYVIFFCPESYSSTAMVNIDIAWHVMTTIPLKVILVVALYQKY